MASRKSALRLLPKLEPPSNIRAVWPTSKDVVFNDGLGDLIQN